MSVLRRLLLAFCLYPLCVAWAQDSGCGPLPLGSPCATGGLATMGATEPAANLGAGNPINWLSGNKYQRDTDLPARRSNPGIELVRHYNSQDTRPSALGRGWSFSYDTRLVQAGARWQILQADGSTLVWPGTLDSPAPSSYGTLRPHQNGWRWRWPNGQTLWFDRLGLLYYMQLAHGQSLRIVRYADGRLHRVQDNHGAWLRFRYFDHKPAAAASSANGKHTIGRNPASSRIHTRLEVTTPHGTFRYGSDSRQGVKRLHYVQRPDGMMRQYHYEPAHQSGWPHALTGISLHAADGLRRIRISTWHYDTQGRARAWFAGHSTDSNVQSVRVQFPSGQPVASGDYRVLHSRSGGGVRIHLSASLEEPRISRIDTLGCTDCGQRGWPGLSLAYNAQGKLLSWSSTLTGTQHWNYNSAGKVQARRLADGSQTRLSYGNDGQLAQVENRYMHQRQTTRIRWHNNRPASVHHPNETQHLLYDAVGRMIERSVQRPDAKRSGNTLVWRERYSWTTAGQLQHHWLPEGGRLDYRWSDDERRLLSLHWQDSKGTRHTVLSSTGQPGYTYGNGLHLQTRQDTRGRVANLQLGQANMAPLWQARLRYSPQGQVATEQHTFRLAPPRKLPRATPLQHTSSWSYAYNTQGQMTAARQNLASTAAGAVKPARHKEALQGAAVPGSTTWYAWHPDGSLAATRNAEGQTTRPHIERNAAGLPVRVGTYAVGYDADRRLIHARSSTRPKVQIRYAHNAYGQRIMRADSTRKTHYLYLNNQLVAERSTRLAEAANSDQATPLVTRRYLYAGLTPVGLIDYDSAGRGRLYAVHADFTGTPRLLTDDQQNVRWLADYSPTGKAQKVAGDMSLLLRAPGQMEDPATGWHDNIMRTYLPNLGQYLEPDPLGPMPGQQALGYAAQQPRRHVDPTGLILFAFDGTRHDASVGSNVWKLSQAYRDGAAYYHRGPGTSLYLDWNALTAADAQQILSTQWQHLLNEIERNNNSPVPLSIDIVGFSRGAALAREFGNRIHQQSPNGYFSINDSLRGALNACVDLRFMGLFDTVAQFGLAGSNNHQYNLTIAPVWTWVAHAVALHERRWLFPLSSAYDGLADNVIEAPFIGAHADIGGGQLGAQGNNEPTPASGDLADVSLAWMAWQARAAGLVFNLQADDRYSASPVLHDERSALLRQVQNGDRSVLTSTSTTLNTYQNDHERLGRQPREQTEPLIVREENWLGSPDSAVGSVDMNGYARWLHDTLGWGAQPA